MRADVVSVSCRRVRLTGGTVLLVTLALAIVAITASTLVGEHGVRHLRRLRTEREQLGTINVSLLQANALLRSEIRRLQSDDLYLEQLARRQLGLVKPGETVYRFRRPAQK